MDTLLKQSEIEDLLMELGMRERQARIGAAIALCEAPVLERAADGQFQANFSAIGDQALANDEWGYSYGGFQIRSKRDQKGTGGIRDEDQLLRPRFNCRSAIAIKRERGGWGDWSTYNSGMYKAYLQDLFPPPTNTYVVVAGDSLSTIADDLPGEWVWQDLARVNGLHDPYVIYIGQYLTLP